ncbi:MAG: YoaK family protein [Candidatus Dormibacteraceae bacterium]
MAGRNCNRPPWLRPRLRNALLLTLTAAAGSADAISYLGLGRVFTANMNGNLVLLGVAIAQGQLAGSIRSVIAFAGFGVGVLIGARVTATTKPTVIWPRSVNLAMFVELGLLMAFGAGWEIAGDQPAALALNSLIALSAAAMGVQTAAARSLAVVGVTTTFVTGTLTSLIAELASASRDWSRWTLWGATLACMVIGAAAGAAMFVSWRPGAPLVGMLLVGIVTAVAATPTPPGK